MGEFMQKLNEPQRETLDRLRLALLGSRHSDLRIRKDGEFHWFEVDWIRDALDMLCGPHPEVEKRKREALKILREHSSGATGPEQAQSSRS